MEVKNNNNNNKKKKRDRCLRKNSPDLANISSILFYSLVTAIKPLVARKKLVQFFDISSGFYRDTDSFHFPFFSLPEKTFA